MRRSSPWICAAALLAWAGCSGEDASPGPAASHSASAAAPAHEDLVARGKRIYMANCIACHNVDPSKSGALGPEVHDASVELLEARVLRGEYPAGYTPKSDTRAMIPLPHLEREIDALAAYLATYR